MNVLSMAFLTVDATTQDLSKEYQRAAMYNLLCASPGGSEHPDIASRLSAQHDKVPFQGAQNAHTVCTWIGVDCTWGLLQTIRWYQESVQLRCLNTHWFPPSLKRIEINNQHSRCPQDFSLRHLPRGLRHIGMRDVNLHGDLDLREMPKKLVELIVPRNFLSGTIDLRCIPEGFVKLDVESNCIELVLVDNMTVPKSLKNVFIRNRLSTFQKPAALLRVHKTSKEPIDDRICIEKYRKGVRTIIR